MFSRPNRYVFSYEKKKRAATRKRTLITIVVILALLLLLFFGFLIYSNSLQVVLNENTTVEINTQAKISQFIKDTGTGALMEDGLVDTSALGEKEVIAKIKTLNDVKEFPFTITVVDTEAPVITVSENETYLLKGTPYDAISKALVNDNSGEEIVMRTEGEYDPEKTGEQIVKLIATDSSGNTSEAELKVNVVELGGDMPDMTFVTTTGHNAKVEGGILTVDNVLIVNDAFPLPDSYNPGMNEEAANAFTEMVTKAGEEYLWLEATSTYVSYQEQSDLYNYYEWEFGNGADYTSYPGYSENQTGLAIDLNYASGDFGYTEEYNWLSSHAADYGFIIRYPEDKSSFTGRSWEPWHIRYVGKDLAKELYKDGKWIALEEYFGIPGSTN